MTGLSPASSWPCRSHSWFATLSQFILIRSPRHSN